MKNIRKFSFGQGTIFHRTNKDGKITDKLWKHFNKVKNLMLKSDNRFTLGFIDHKEFPVDASNMCVNQVIVLFTNGRYEVLPYKIHGSLIKDYLGVHFLKIKAWSVMPALGSEVNRGGVVGANVNLERDIYNC